jgi:hypothetical protein
MAIKKEYLTVGGLALVLAVIVILMGGCCQGQAPKTGLGSQSQPYEWTIWQGPGYYCMRAGPIIMIYPPPPCTSVVYVGSEYQFTHTVMPL